MLLSRDNGWQNGILRCVLMDNTSSTGGALVGLTPASPGLLISTIADVEAVPTPYSAASATIATIATLGVYGAPAAGTCRFQQVDATNHPGLYELQFLNSRFSVGNASHLIVTIAAPGSKCSPQSFLIDLDSQVDTVAFGGITGTSVGGIPAVNMAQIAGQAGLVTNLALELAGRIAGTVTSATFAPTATQFECSNINDTAAFNVYINRGYLITSGALVKGAGTILADILGTSGRRFTVAAQQQPFANGDTLLIM